jgi:hypothetical protein
MARDNDRERERDLATLDRLVARMEKQLDEYDSPQITALFAKELPKLLERRAALLGLDAPTGKNDKPNQSGTLAELEQKLALVDKHRAS